MLKKSAEISRMRKNKAQNHGGTADIKKKTSSRFACQHQDYQSPYKRNEKLKIKRMKPHVNGMD